ncbi:hypothetical protein GCM10027317_47380 [Massilia agri]
MALDRDAEHPDKINVIARNLGRLAIDAINDEKQTWIRELWAPRATQGKAGPSFPGSFGGQRSVIVLDVQLPRRKKPRLMAGLGESQFSGGRG